MKRIVLLLGAAFLLAPAVAWAQPRPVDPGRLPFMGPRLGVQILTLTDELRVFFGAPKDAGVLVARVEPASAAAQAGIKVGDVLTAVAGTQVADVSDVRRALSGRREGETIELAVVRDHHTLALRARVPRAEAGPAWQPPEWPMFRDEGDLMRRLEALERRVEQLESKVR